VVIQTIECLKEQVTRLRRINEACFYNNFSHTNFVSYVIRYHQDIVNAARILIGYGLAQLFGGLLLVFTKTRFVGAAIVAVTFLVSLALLLIEGNIPVSIITMVATLLLGVVMKQSWRPVAQ
jgi:hypothetical protein